jgi:hypothetical protein
MDALPDLLDVPADDSRRPGTNFLKGRRERGSAFQVGNGAFTVLRLGSGRTTPSRSGRKYFSGECLIRKSVNFPMIFCG